MTSLLRATAFAVAVLLFFVLGAHASGQGCGRFTACSSCVTNRSTSTGSGSNCKWCIYAGRCMEGNQCLQYATQTYISNAEATTPASCPTISDFKPNHLPKGKPGWVTFRINFPFIGQMECRFSDLGHRSDVSGPITSRAMPTNNHQNEFTCITPAVLQSSQGNVMTRVEIFRLDGLSGVAISGSMNLVFTACHGSSCATNTNQPSPSGQPATTHRPGPRVVQSTTPSSSHLPALTHPSRSRCTIAGGVDLVFHVANIRTLNHVTATFVHPGKAMTVDCRFFNKGTRLRCPIPGVQRIGTVSTVSINAQVAVFHSIATITYDDVPRFDVKRHNHTVDSKTLLLLEGVRIMSGGLTSNDYKVQIGNSVCSEIVLTDTILSCWPKDLSVTLPGRDYPITVTAGHYQVNVGSVSVHKAEAKNEVKNEAKNETETETKVPETEEVSSSTTLAVSMGVVGVLLVVLPAIALVLVRSGRLQSLNVTVPYKRDFKRRDSQQPLGMEVPESTCAVTLSSVENRDVLDAAAKCGIHHEGSTSVKSDRAYVNQAIDSSRADQAYDDAMSGGLAALRQDNRTSTNGEVENFYANPTRTTAPAPAGTDPCVVQMDEDIYS